MTELIATNTTDKGRPNIPTPRINLSSLELIRLEASRVYREMRAGTIAPQDGSRLIYSLVSISKMIEAEETQQEHRELTIAPEQPISMLDGIELSKLSIEQLDALEMAVNIVDCIRESKPLPEPPPPPNPYILSMRRKLND